MVRAFTMVMCGVAIGFSALSESSAQAPRFEASLGLAAGGPTRTTAEYATVAGTYRLSSVGRLSFAVDATGMLKLREVNVACPTIPGFACDSRELGHVGRIGLAMRYGAREGRGAFALAFAGGWLSQWATERLSGASSQMDRPYGAVLELGAGTSLPLGDRRTGVELRYGRFDGVQASTYGLLGSGNSLRLSFTRRW